MRMLRTRGELPDDISHDLALYTDADVLFTQEAVSCLRDTTVCARQHRRGALHRRHAALSAAADGLGPSLNSGSWQHVESAPSSRSGAGHRDMIRLAASCGFGLRGLWL